MNILFPMLFFLLPLFGLMFFVRILLGPFYPKIWEQMKRHPTLHIIWGVYAVLSFYFVFIFIPAGPPAWVDRISQQKALQQRVNLAGGWRAIRQDCILFVSNRNECFYWRPPATNVTVYPDPQNNPHYSYKTNLNYGQLPPALAALKPREIEYSPPSMRIRLFGMHSTGGLSTPYLGLEIACGTNITEYHPPERNSGVTKNNHPTYRQIAEGVFEVY